MPFRKPGEEGARRTDVTETLVARGTAGAVAVAWDADQAVTALYSANYRSLVRLAAMLVRDAGTAEEVVQDAFVAMHGGWRRLRDPDKGLSYLRQSVVNRSRSVLRHRAVVEKYAPKACPTRRARRPGPSGSWNARRSSTRCPGFPPASGRHSSSATTPISPKRRSRTRWASPRCREKPYGAWNDRATQRPGAVLMTTDPHDEHGEILRRALRAEADSVNPAGDGLEHIRARIADGQSRRFGLGRFFGPARFGLDRFALNWARPVLAVAAAVLIAALGVTAPQTMSLIQQTVGNNGPSDGGQGNTGKDRTDAQGNPQFPDPSSPGASASGSPSAASTVSPSSSPGLSSCRIPQPGAASASPARPPRRPRRPRRARARRRRRRRPRRRRRRRPRRRARRSPPTRRR